MDHNLLNSFQSFLEKKCDCVTVQNNIINNSIKYMRAHFGTYPLDGMRLHHFFRKVEKQTEIVRKTNRDKYNAEYCDLNDPEKYYDNIKTRFREGKHEPNFAYAVYYWLHAFAKDTSHAHKINAEIIKVYPEIEAKLLDITKRINTHPEAQDFESISMDIEENEYGEASNASDQNKPLAEEEREKLVAEIEKLANGELIYIEFYIPEITKEKQFIGAEVACNKGYAKLACDGLGYEFVVQLKEVVLRFKFTGVDFIKLKEKIGFIYSRSKNYQEIVIQSPSHNKPLRGNLLLDSQNNLYEVLLKEESKDYKITAQHILKRDHVMVNCILKPHYKRESAEKEHTIAEMIENEVLRVCAGQKQTFSSGISLEGGLSDG